MKAASMASPAHLLLAIGLALGQIPAPPPPPPATGARTAMHTTDMLDLNTASVAELARLPGMGVEYARRIVEGRPYLAKNQLVTRGVLPPAAYDRIKDRIVAHRISRAD